MASKKNALLKSLTMLLHTEKQLNPIEGYGILIAFLAETLPMISSEAVSSSYTENWQEAVGES